MTLHVDVDRASNSPAPEASSIRRWIETAWKAADMLIHPDVRRIEVSVRIVDENEMHLLNRTWRGQDKSTNVLSFPSDNPPAGKLCHLGDIVACGPVIIREADEQDKTLEAHWAHMCVHGTLHLLGHDHINAEDATVMEDLETHILASLNFPNPYSGKLAREDFNTA